MSSHSGDSESAAPALSERLMRRSRPAITSGGMSLSCSFSSSETPGRATSAWLKCMYQLAFLAAQPTPSLKSMYLARLSAVPKANCMTLPAPERIVEPPSLAAMPPVTDS